jgi:hypothetical protein
MSKKVWNGKIEKDEFVQLQESSAKIMGLNKVKNEAGESELKTAVDFFKYFQQWALDAEEYSWLEPIQTDVIENNGLIHDLESVYDGGDAEADNSAYIQSDPFAPNWGIKDVAFAVRINKDDKRSVTYFNPSIQVLKSNADSGSLAIAKKIANDYANKVDEYLSENPMKVQNEGTVSYRYSKLEANESIGIPFRKGMVIRKGDLINFYGHKYVAIKDIDPNGYNIDAIMASGIPKDVATLYLTTFDNEDENEGIRIFSKKNPVESVKDSIPDINKRIFIKNFHGYPTIKGEEPLFSWFVFYDQKDDEWVFEVEGQDYSVTGVETTFNTLPELVRFMNDKSIDVSENDFQPIVAGDVQEEKRDEGDDIMVKAMDVDTSKYELSHGRKPSGGYGSWLFGKMLTQRTTGDVAEIGSSDVFEYIGKYGDAKKKAIKHAKEKGWKDVEVLP